MEKPSAGHDRPRLTRSVDAARDTVGSARTRAEHSIGWNVWERMLENQFVDRSVALAGKAFVSFFPLVIVVAAFMPPHTRASILTTLTNRLGVRGHALSLAKAAFASSDHIRRASGILGLVLTLFYATSFTTALERVYIEVWRRPPARGLAGYVRGPAWLAVLLGYMAMIGELRGLLGPGVGYAVFLVVALAFSICWWWVTEAFFLKRQVRWRVLLPGAVVTGVAVSGYALVANLWMPFLVTQNQSQFGFIGVALSLVTWFTGTAICLFVGACAGPVLAEDPGPIGRLARGNSPELLVAGAAPARPAPTRELGLRDAFESDAGPADPA